MRHEEATKKKERQRNFYDYSLLFIIIFLLCFGLVMLYSTSSYVAKLEYGDSAFYLKKQAFATILGAVVMIVISVIDYHFWEKFAWIAYFASIVLILAVKIPGLGRTSRGATRWLMIGKLSFQPSEFAKVAVILLLAHLVKNNTKRMNKIWTMSKMLLLVIPVSFILVAVTSNLSTAIIVLGIALLMLFVASPSYGIFIFGGALITGTVYFVVTKIDWLVEAVGGYRLDRILVWLNPEAYPLDGGFQVLQGLYAIGSGGLFGRGLGNSIQKLSFLPEPQNDMIFAIICEELGLFGAVCVILLFLFMLWRFMIIANNAPDLFGSLIVVGVMGHIAIQVILNIAVVTNTIPNTGITLPFISYGGTSILFLLAEMGLVLGVSKRIKLER
ncbi:MAG: putative lipid II flippase FtsW [Clostridiales bacterium]|nr:putative lipid II flippase FtsW [Clostridiales bacterium]